MKSGSRAATSDQLAAKTGRNVETVAADLGDRASSKRVEAILRSDARISLLINNAGTAAITPLLNTDVEQMSELVAINIDALVRLTYAAVPGFVERGGGTIINIASAVAIGPETLNGVYGASKAFVPAFSQSLKHELTDKGVRVQVVLPGATATEIWANSGLPVAPRAVDPLVERLCEACQVGHDEAAIDGLAGRFDAGDDTALGLQVLIFKVSL
jgi:hypothetical protein